ncbi:cytidine/deoxycytidylate deaminase family protein [Allosalinactinospora lopnorensis]|uniref:dCMP deaminase n=1 Tax=Allosalinactinospora lopnorensis TaxID=1352348 RepID=UPI000623EA3C|nr:dCMP deaminase [Allosalinactinospora lopnorensis]
MTPDEVTEADLRWLRSAIELSRRCPPSETAYSVGAVVLDADGGLLAEGYSRQTDPYDHAEEAALRSLDPGDPRLRTATLYSSLEPCSVRALRPLSCSDLILKTPIPRIVFAWREPTIFVNGDGAERLQDAGRTVVEAPDLAPLVREINNHLLKG